MPWIASLVMFALAVAVPPADWTPMTVKALWQLPPDRIADIVLPPGHAPIAKVRFGSPGPPVASVDWLSLYTAATPIGADFCGQEMIEAHVTPIPKNPDALLDKAPALLAKPDQFPMYRLKRAREQCDGAATFFTIDGMSRDEAFAILRMVDVAANAARRKGPRRPPSFAARCRDILPNCTARNMLAAADLGSVLGISSPPAASLRENGRVARQAAARGWHYGSLEIGQIGGMDRESIELAYSRGRIMALSISRGTIIY